MNGKVNFAYVWDKNKNLKEKVNVILFQSPIFPSFSTDKIRKSSPDLCICVIYQTTRIIRTAFVVRVRNGVGLYGVTVFCHKIDHQLYTNL